MIPIILAILLVVYLILHRKNTTINLDKYLFSYYFNSNLIKNILVDFKDFENYIIFNENIGTIGIRLTIFKQNKKFISIFTYFENNTAKTIKFEGRLPFLRKDYTKDKHTLIINPL